MFDKLSALLSKSTISTGPLTPAHQELALKDGENRFVAVLFADIKGFTAMSEYLSPDILQVLIDQIMVSFSERVTKYGGYVDKYEGDRIMVHFGSMQYSENNARRAVYTGLELIEVIKNFNQLRATIPELALIKDDLAVRVGINCGMVATGKIGLKREGDFTIYGDVVNVASRMEEMGIPMQVSLPDNMKAALEGYFSFNYQGEFVVKGKSNLIKIWTVEQPFFRQLSRLISESTFIGREAELNILLTWYRKNVQLMQDGIFQDPVSIIAISALAGMGKTRLLKEFQKELPDQGFLVSEISPVYQPPFASFKQIIRDFFCLPEELCPEEATHIIQTKLDDFKGKIEPELLKALIDALPQLVFIAGYAISPGMACETREDAGAVLNQSILLLFKAIALYQAFNNQALVIIFDDLHFIDEASLGCLNFLIKHLSRVQAKNTTVKTRIMIIFSFRKGQLPKDLDLAKLQRENILLEELNQKQIALFIGNSLQGYDIPACVLKKLAKVSAGNPFYIEEWVASIKRTLNNKDSIDHDDFAIPDNVLELVLSRLMSLDKLSAVLLQKASAIGQTFMKSTLQKVDAKLAPHSNIELSMEQSCAIEFLNEGFAKGWDTEYSFRHCILHQAVYDSILTINRQLMHKTVAEVIEEQYQDVLPQWYFALEHHYYEANATEKWIHYLYESISFARTVFMNKKALEYCDKLIMSGKEPSLERVKLIKAEILLDMGNYKHACEVLDEIEPLCEKMKNINDSFVIAKTRVLMATDNMQKARSFLEDHLNSFTTEEASHLAMIMFLDIKRQCKDFSGFESLAEELHSKLLHTPCLLARLENTMGLYYQNISEFSRAIVHYDLALEHGKDNKTMTSRIYHNKANVLCKLGRPEEAILNYQQAMQLVRFLDDEGGKARIGCDLGTLYEAKGDYVLAAKNLKESSEMAVAAGNLSLASDINYNLAKLLFSEGKLSPAHTAVKKCIKQFSNMHNLKGLSYANDLLADVLFNQTKYNEAEEVYLTNLAFQKQIDDREGIAHTYGNLANIAAEKQDWQTAEKYYEMQARLLAEYGDVEGEGKAWYNWAIQDEERGYVDQALTKAEKALHLFQKGGFDMYLKDVEEFLEELRGKQSSSL